MTNTFFDRAYNTTDQQDVKDLYEDWADTYDAELIANGYQTPARCASALAAHLDNRNLPVFDFACGTGMSGAALAALGFQTIDGVDISEAMLRAAQARGVYRQLTLTQPGEPPIVTPGEYAAITAMGALSPGAAPAEYLDLLLACLAPGGFLVFSYNDHTLADPAYTTRRDAALAEGRAREITKERGVHIAKLGSESVIYVFEKT